MPKSHTTTQEHASHAPDRRRRVGSPLRPIRFLREGAVPPDGYVELDGRAIHALRHRPPANRKPMTQGELAAAMTSVQPGGAYIWHQTDICRIEGQRVATRPEIAMVLAKALSAFHRGIRWQQIVKHTEQSRQRPSPPQQLALPDASA